MESYTTPVATALLLNWKRPDNLKKTIKSIRAQAIPVEIFLWDNNPGDRFDVDLHIRSDKNLMCWPRWFMANYAKSKWVFSMDDDLAFRDGGVLADAIHIAEELDAPVGVGGLVNTEEDFQYIFNRTQTTPCDAIQGRFLLIKRDKLNDVSLMPREEGESGPRIEDDIIISASSMEKFVIGMLHRRMAELQTGQESLCLQEDHKPSRKKTLDKYFPYESN